MSEATPWSRGWKVEEERAESFKPPTAAVNSVTTTTTTNVSTQKALQQRNFTLSQLQECDGGLLTSSRRRPLYVALKKIVYDVGGCEDVYGEGGEYHWLTGHEASYCVARSCSNREDLDHMDWSDLSSRESMTLGAWEEILIVRECAVVGKVIHPLPEPSPMILDDLAASCAKAIHMPDGWAIPPLLVGCNGTVFDVSFGGIDMYGPKGPYVCLAGKDASRVLAKMSMTEADINGSLDYENLTPKERVNLLDWHRKLTAKGYPIVGLLPGGRVIATEEEKSKTPGAMF